MQKRKEKAAVGRLYLVERKGRGERGRKRKDLLEKKKEGRPLFFAETFKKEMKKKRNEPLWILDRIKKTRTTLSRKKK